MEDLIKLHKETIEFLLQIKRVPEEDRFPCITDEALDNLIREHTYNMTLAMIALSMMSDL